jgi:hypothetical protein
MMAITMQRIFSASYFAKGTDRDETLPTINANTVVKSGRPGSNISVTVNADNTATIAPDP